MKWTHFLMAIYLMAVSFYPCTDSDIVDATDNAVELTHNHEHHSDDGAHHICPPFCACNCCSVKVLNYSTSFTFEFPLPYNSIALKESFYVYNLSDSYSGSIWQPPQLV